MQSGKTKRNLFCVAAAAAAAAVYYRHIARFFPNADGYLGHDYGYFMPRLLANLYSGYQDSPLLAPLFTPAFCGGVPALGNPQSFYYSIPQLLAVFLPPTDAFRVTTLLFGLLGGVGTYFLCRKRFGMKPSFALFAAIAFGLNGFLSHRMIIGHVSFHGFAWLPWIAWMSLPIGDESLARQRLWPSVIARCAAVALMFAYIIHSGGAVICLPVVLGVGLLFLLQIAMGRVPFRWALGLVRGRSPGIDGIFGQDSSCIGFSKRIPPAAGYRPAWLDH